MKRITLWLLRRMLNKYCFEDRKFRIDVCREIHRYHNHQYNEQTGYGRYYDAIGDMIEAGNEDITTCEDFYVEGGIMSEFKEIKTYIKNKPRRNKLKRILNENPTNK